MRDLEQTDPALASHVRDAVTVACQLLELSVTSLVEFSKVFIQNQNVSNGAVVCCPATMISQKFLINKWKTKDKKGKKDKKDKYTPLRNLVSLTYKGDSELQELGKKLAGSFEKVVSQPACTLATKSINSGTHPL
jgi:hypothetical protein